MKTTIKPELLKLYKQCRERKPFMLVGHDAQCSLDAARTILAFREAESKGLVRMRAEPERESYWDVYGKPEGYTNAQGHEVSTEDERKETEDLLERLGCWWTVSEWFDGDEWQHADSCGMHTGYENPLDPFENCYVVQEMQAALDALAKHQDGEAFENSERENAACRDIVTA